MPSAAPSFAALRTPTPGPWMEALVANVQDAIVILDGEGRIIFESPSASQILGIPPDDVLGTFGLSRIHPEDRQAVVSSFERTIAAPGSIARATYRFQRADGRWQHLEALAKNLLHDPELQGVLITFRDVSERVHATEAAERADRARDAFLYNVSQELAAPLHALLACVSAPEGSLTPHPSLRAEQIRQHASHLLRLIQIATDLTGVRNGLVALANELLCLDAVVVEALAVLEGQSVRRDVQLHVELRAPEARIMGDRERLSQMLIDLIDGLRRSAKYSAAIIITSAETGSGHARLEVESGSDNISERHLQEVFDQLGRAGLEAAVPDQHGLGIAIASRLIELMGGAMGVESTPDGGTRVWIQLPTS